MNKDIRNMVKDAMVLFVITLIAGLVLGVVYQVTKEPIAAQQEKAKQRACMEVFADAASFEAVEAQSHGRILGGAGLFRRGYRRDVSGVRRQWKCAWLCHYSG